MLFYSNLNLFLNCERKSRNLSIKIVNSFNHATSLSLFILFYLYRPDCGGGRDAFPLTTTASAATTTSVTI